MVALKAGEVQVTHLARVERVQLPRGSWSSMVISSKQVLGNRSSLGYSVFKPGTALLPVKHNVEEVAMILQGTGKLQLDERAITYKTGDALFIPAGVWHAVINDGSEDVIMVFGFPYPDYPPTESRASK
ncbi:MAG TPA: cupin domain-containing protein [Candidatus Fraserbacteria bacterium]|mgnify:CR=1 FL=1|nr:cupin domain-containing protein [Candidatus Fraserbacteria bacterium]